MPGKPANKHKQNRQPFSLDWDKLKICVLQPDYTPCDVDYKEYDPPRELSHFIPSAKFDHILLNKLTTYKQLKELQKNSYDIFVNLCEGYLEWEVPSIDVIYFMELLNLPFTGPTSLLYDPPKELMKYVAYTEGVATPEYVLIEDKKQNIESLCSKLRYPLFVKPHKAGDSLGVDHSSLVRNIDELKQKANAIIDEYAPLLVEEYVEGREFTVMLAANNGKEPTVFHPVEYIFPEGFQYKTYSLKTSELHPNANIPVAEEGICERLQDAAKKIFKAFQGVGYGRLDFRMNADGELFFLEINFTCSVFYKDGYEGSADYILKYDGYGQANFLKHIIAEGIARHKQKQKKYYVKGSPIAGYGIYAVEKINANDVVFKGEELAQRIVTKRHVEENWDDNQKEIFRKYAYPLSKEVFLLWDNNPCEWAPQNHSCSPNTVYNGLDVVATRNILKDEELTLDYASFLDENMEPFNCQCGVNNCRGLVNGIENNSVTEREEKPQLKLS